MKGPAHPYIIERCLIETEIDRVVRPAQRGHAVEPGIRTVLSSSFSISNVGGRIRSTRLARNSAASVAASRVKKQANGIDIRQLPPLLVAHEVIRIFHQQGALTRANSLSINAQCQ